MKYKKARLNAPLKVIISFVVVTLIGSFLLSLPISSNDGNWFPYINALFTSTSSVCVTGLVVVDTAVHFSLFGQIVILLLIQVGGIGFISLSALFLLAAGKRLGYKNRVMLQESLNQDSTQGIVLLIKNIAKIVFIIEGVGFVCLLPSMIVHYGFFDGLFKALFLSVSAFCNAGFDILGTTGTEFASLSPFATKAYVLLPIMFLIVLGGVGYATIVEIANKCKKETSKKLTFQAKIIIKLTIFLILVGALLFAIFEWNNPNTIGNMSTFDKIMNCLFQSITPRTAGFSTFDQAGLTPSGRVVTDILMFIGGSPGSIAGGIKTTTIFVLFAAAFRSTGEKGDVIILRKKIKNQTIIKALRIVGLAAILTILATITICVIEKNNPVAASSGAVIFEVISAISTVGITLGLTPTLSIASKIILIMLMFIGRVGTMTIAFAIHKKSPDAYGEIEYGDSKIIVG